MKKLVLIFGAGSGIGQAIFENVKARRDSNLFLTGFSRRGLPYQNGILENENLQFDLRERKDLEHFDLSLKTFIHDNEKEFNELVVYFAQGDGLFKPIEEIAVSELVDHFDLNVFSSIAILKMIAPYIKKFGQSTVIFLSSTASRMGFSDSTAYCASKHAVAGLAKALREEWKQYQVKVVNAYMGAVATSIWDKRADFSKNDMISVSDAGEFLASLSYLPQSLYLDEVYITPNKGVL